MKYTFVWVVLIGSVIVAQAYQTGPASRANFGAAQEQEAQTPASNYRSFSNYNNRNWGQGVQTQTVQTEVAGSSAVDLQQKATKAPVSKKQQAPAAKPASPTKPASAVTPTQPSSAAAQMPANVDPAAMMQQVQGMMQSLNSAGGGAAAMPDLSGLMGGAAAPAAGTAPAKK